MDRRAFLQASAATAGAAVLPLRQALASAAWRTFEVVTRVEVLNPRGVSRAWVPLPMVDDTDWQQTIGSNWTGNAHHARIVSDGKYGAGMLYAEWRDGESAPAVEVTSRFMTRDRAVTLDRPVPNAAPLAAAERAFYLAPTDLIPTDGVVQEDGARGDPGREDRRRQGACDL